MSELPRAISRPGGLPLYAWVGPDNVIKGQITFEDPSRYPGDGQQADGSRYLPIFGDEPPADFFDRDRHYFRDEFHVEDDRVIRNRTVCDR
jgi:hypothetical protein